MASRTKLGTLFVDLELQMPDFQAVVSKGRSQALNYGKELEQAMKGTRLTPMVDMGNLHSLNREFDRKIQHHRQVQTAFNSKPITVKVDMRQLDQLEKKIAKLKSVSVGLKVGATGAKPDNKGWLDDIDKSIARSMSKGGGIGGAAKAVILAPFKMVGSVVSKAIEGILSGIARQFGSSAWKQVSKYLESQSGSITGSSRLIGEKFAESFLKAISEAVSGGRIGAFFGQSIGAAIKGIKDQLKRYSSELNQIMKGSRITPTVDLTNLHSLNREFDRKIQHHRQVQSVFDSKPLTVKVETRQLDELEERLAGLQSISVDVNATGKGASTPANKNLANEIGRAVASNMNRGGGIGGAVASVATAPIRMAGAAVGKVTEGLVFGVTQQVGANLGKGLSTALESQIGKVVGSSEMMGEKLGGAFLGAIGSKLSGGNIGSTIDQAIDNAISGIKNRKVRDQIREIADVGRYTVSAASNAVTSNLGTFEEITQESLFRRRSSAQEIKQRLPAAQEQSAYDWRQALLKRDAVVPAATQRIQSARSKVKELQPLAQTAISEAKVKQQELDEAMKPVLAQRNRLAQLQAKEREFAAIGIAPSQFESLPFDDYQQLRREVQTYQKQEAQLQRLRTRSTEYDQAAKVVSETDPAKLRQMISAFDKDYQQRSAQMTTGDERFTENYLKETLKGYSNQAGLQSMSRQEQVAVAKQIEQSAMDDSRFNASLLKEKLQEYNRSQKIVSKTPIQQVRQQISELERIAPDAQMQSKLAKPLIQASSRAEKLTKDIEIYQKQIAIAENAIKEANAEVKTTKARLNAVTQTVSEPQAYQDLFQSVAPQAPTSKMPALRVDEQSLSQAGAISQYDAARNAIEVTQKMYDAIQSNSLTFDQIKTLREELEHAVDADFGSYQGMQAFKNNRIVGEPVQYTAEEFQEIAPELGFYSPERRALELNAKVKASRGMAQSEAMQRQQVMLEYTPALVNDKRNLASQSEAFEAELTRYRSLAKAAGNDVSKAVQSYRAFFKQVAAQVSELADQVLDKSSTMSVQDFQKAVRRSSGYVKTLGLVQEKALAGSIEQAEQLRVLGRQDMGMGLAYTPQTEQAPIIPEREFLDPRQDAWDVKPTVMGKLERFRDVTADRVGLIRERIEAGMPVLKRGATTAARGAGLVAGGTYGLSMNVLSSPQSAAVGKNLASAGLALARVAKTGYQLAQGMESFTLALAPYGSQLKKVVQHTVLPAATFAAATHFLPGGAQAGQFLIEGAQTAISPLSQMAGSSLGASAGELASSIVPNIMGAQTAAATAATSAVEGLVAGVTGPLGQIAATLLGGKVLQNVGTMPINAVNRMVEKRQDASLSLPASPIPLALKAAPEPEPIALPSAQSTQMVKRQSAELEPQKPVVIKPADPDRANRVKTNIADAEKNRKIAQKSAVEITRKAGEVTGRTAAKVLKSVDDIRAEAQRMEKAFSSLYQGLKEAQKKGNDLLVKAFGQEIKDLEAKTQEQLNALINQAKEAGDRKLLGEIGGVKGRMTQRQNQAQKMLQSYTPTGQGWMSGQDPSDPYGNLKPAAQLSPEDLGENLKAQQMLEFGRRNLNRKTTNPAESEFLNYIRKLLDHATQAADRYDSAMKRAMKTSTARYEASNEAIQPIVNPDNKELVSRVQGRMASIDQTMQELEQDYERRLQQAQQATADLLEEQERYRQAYAEMQGLDPDSAQAMLPGFGGNPPSPPNDPPDDLFSALTGDIKSMIGSLGGVPGVAKLAIGALIGFAGIDFFGEALRGLGNLIGQIANAAVAVESLQAKFSANFGASASDNFDKATQGAIDLRQNISASREAYIQFATAVKGTPLERTTDAGLEALNKAALVQGLSDEQSERARTAIIQSAGKGQLYSEEVFGQLAEALPNAPAVLARSIGTDIAGLRARMKNGLAAEEVLPAFFAQLSAESEIGVSGALDTTAASMTNLSNQTQLLQEAVGKEMLPAKKLGLDTLALAAESATKVLPILIDLIGALSIAVGVKLVGAMASMAGVNFGTMLASASSGLMAFSKSIGAMLASANWSSISAGAVNAFGAIQGGWQKTIGFLKANPMIAGVAGIFAGFQVLKMIGAMFADAGGAAREFADNSKKALKEYRESVERDGKAPELLGDTGKSALEETLIGGLIGRDAARGLERGGNKLMEMAGTGLVKNQETGQYERGKMEFDIPEWVPLVGGNTFTPGFTTGQKQFQDQVIARNDAISQSDIIQGEMIKLQQSGVSDQIRDINAQIKAIQTKRRSIPRGKATDQEIADLSEQERLLTDQREQLQKPGRFFSGRNAAAIELFRKLRDEATDPATYEQMDKALKTAVAEQNRFNESFANTVRSAEALQGELTKIGAVLEENNQKISIFAANARADVADSRIAGATEGQAGYQEFQNQQQESVQRIQATNQAITDSVALLNDVETQRILAANNFTNESSAADIRAKAGRMEDSPDKERLDVAADQIEKITGLKETNANNNAQLKEAQAAFVQKMRDLAKSVLDFYRGVEQQAIETAMNTKRLGVEMGISAAQTRLKSAMVGFQRSFTNDFVESLIQMVETLGKPAQAALDAQQQITQAQQAYFQQIQQANQLQQQLPQQADLNYGGNALNAGMGTALPGQPGTPTATVPGTPNQTGLPQVQGEPLANVPNTIAQLSPDQIAEKTTAINQLTAPESVQFSGQGLQQGLDLAGASYQQQVANINRRMAMQQEQAQMELAMAMSQADFQAQQAVRTMNDQGRGFTRGTEDLQLQGQAQTPEVELQSQLNGLYRQYEDQLLAISDFEAGLTQTLDQQLMVRDQILSGALPEEFKALLPAINETIATAEQQLSDLAANSQAYNDAYTAAVAEQRRLAEQARQDRTADAQSRVQDSSNQELSGKAALARAQGQGAVANDLDLRSQIESALKNYQDQMISLERESRLNPELAARSDELEASFARLRDMSIATAEAEWQRQQQENRFAAESRRLAGQAELTQGTATLMTNRASLDRSEGFNTRGIEANQMALQANIQNQQNSFRERIKELEDMQRAGSLTAAEFTNLKNQAEQFNNVSLANIRAEFEKTQQGNRDAAKQRIGSLQSELGGMKVERLRGEGKDEQAAKTEEKLKKASARAGFAERIKELQDMRNAGSLANQEFNQMHSLIVKIHHANLQAASSRERPKTVSTVMGRLHKLGIDGDLSTAFSAAFARQSVKFNEAMNFNKSLDSRQISGGAIMSAVSGGNATDVVQRLDTLIAVSKQQANSLSRPNLTVNSTDAIGSAAGIYNDISRDTMRGAGL